MISDLRCPRLYEVIDGANSQGRLGLIVYVVPGFPDEDAYRYILCHLDNRADVSVIETTIPVDGGFSDHASPTIIRAHLAAVSQDSAIGPIPQTKTPQLAVIYRDTVERDGLAATINRLSPMVSGVVLEWDERRHNAMYREEFAAARIELVECVGPWMAPHRIGQIIDPAPDNPLVYLMSAERTGAKLFDAASIQKCVDDIRRRRPDARIAAGFGVAARGDVLAIGRVEGIHAVIVGTAFLKALGRGVDQAVDLIDELAVACGEAPR